LCFHFPKSAVSIIKPLNSERNHSEKVVLTKISENLSDFVVNLSSFCVKLRLEALHTTGDLMTLKEKTAGLTAPNSALPTVLRSAAEVADRRHGRSIESFKRSPSG
jgi:hypothetical protein